MQQDCLDYTTHTFTSTIFSLSARIEDLEEDDEPAVSTTWDLDKQQPVCKQCVWITTKHSAALS